MSRFRNRIFAACRTNEAEVLYVVAMTSINYYQISTIEKPVPLLAWIVTPLVWIAVAFAVNLIDPIEPRRP